MAKSPDAFRTISEVADWLGVQAHVLRFWESKFAQVKPIKRAGGRRYYRPSDMLLLGGLKKVLHEDGLTIKGAQKMLREKGVGYIADLSQPLDDLTIAVIEGSSTPVEPDAPQEISEAPLAANATEDDADAAHDMPPETEDLTEGPLEALPEHQDPGNDLESDQADDIPETATPDVLPSFRARPRDTAPSEKPAEAAVASQTDAAPKPEPAPEPEDVAPEVQPPKPKRVEVTLIHDHTQIDAAPSAMSQVKVIRTLSAEHAQQIRPLVARLTRLRASMANPRKEFRKD